MTTRGQILRSSVTGNIPAAGTRQPGETWVNFPDLQLGVIDTGRNAQKLLAVRVFSTSANYAIGDFVVQAGALYVANSAVTAGAFNASKWNKIVVVGDLATLPYLPIAGGTLTGPLLLAADPSAALGAATKQYVDTKAGLYLPLAGGTLTGALTLVGAPSYATLQLAKSASGNANQVIGFTGGIGSTQARWNMQIGDTAAESGSNAGSNFGISRYSDAGAFIDTPFSISRATGAATFGGSGASAFSIANPSGSALMYLNSPVASPNGIFGQKGGLNRWQMQLGIGGPEGGGNAGSDFGLYRYNDAGTLIDQPLAISRATGAASFTGAISSGPLTVNGVLSTTGNINGGAGGYVATTYLRMGSTNYNFNVSGSALQVGVNGATFGTLPKSLVVGSFTSILDTTALNAAGAQMAVWSGGTAGTWSVAISSDRRLKSGLALSSKDALEAIAAMPVYECDMTQPLEGATEQHWDWALIADEVKPVVPLAVMDADPEAGIEYAAMRDYPLIPLLIRAVQQLTERVAELEAAAA